MPTALFYEWKSIFDKYLKQEINELQENYLTKLNLKIHISPNCEFKGRKARWLAVYQKSTRETITSRTIPIAVNYALMYKEIQNHRGSIPIKTTATIPPLKSIKDKQGRDKHFKKTNDNRENELEHFL